MVEPFPLGVSHLLLELVGVAGGFLPGCPAFRGGGAIRIMLNNIRKSWGQWVPKTRFSKVG